MIEKIMNECNQDEKIKPMDKTTKEFQEVRFLFNTIFNDITQQSQEKKTFGIDQSFSLKNKYITLNFEKREKSEITSYGWYFSETSDDKKFEELKYRLRLKGQDKIGFDINVSPLSVPNEEKSDIFICKFIVGECYILFQGDELDKTKEELAENYDTIVKILDNKTRKYEVLKPENIQLLYLVKLKDPDLELKTIQCSSNNCKLNEQPPSEIPIQDRKMCYCLLCDNYLCKNCHIEFHHNQILFGEFGPENCEQKPFINNYQGECDNPIHTNNNSNSNNNTNAKKEVKETKETIEYFCRECNKGICSSCRFTGNEKHKHLELISNLFSSCAITDKNTTFKKMELDFSNKTKLLSNKIEKIQSKNREAADNLRAIMVLGFQKMFKETNDSFTHEGELLLGMCYQLNYLKDCIQNFHKLYGERESLLKGTKLKQELYWTKMIHYEHLLYLIEIKETIKTGYKVDHKNFDKIVNKYKKKLNYPLSIFQMMDDFGYKEIIPSKQNMNITLKVLADEAGINYGKMMKKK